MLPRAAESERIHLWRSVFTVSGFAKYSLPISTCFVAWNLKAMQHFEHIDSWKDRNHVEETVRGWLIRDHPCPWCWNTSYFDCRDVRAINWKGHWGLTVLSIKPPSCVSWHNHAGRFFQQALSVLSVWMEAICPTGFLQEDWVMDN